MWIRFGSTAKTVRFGDCNHLRNAVFIGALTGLSILTKSSALALIPALILALIFLLKNRQVSVKFVSISVCLALLFALPLWLRNMQVYGDPLALKAFKDSFGGSAQASTFINGVGAFSYWTDWVLWWTSRSAIGVGGYMDIFMPQNFYFGAIGLISLLPILGLVNRAAVKEITPDEKQIQGQLKWTFGVFVFTVLALFISFNSTYFQAQARYLLPAFAIFAAWIGRKESQLHEAKFPVIIFSLCLGLSLYFGSTLPAEFARRIITP